MEPLGIDSQNAVIGLLGVLVAILAWIGKNLHDRVTLLEREKADKLEMKELLKELKGDFEKALNTQTTLLVGLLRGDK